jgi:hypothetical protein
MPKTPRKYKQYLWNEQISMPKSTKYFQLKNGTNSTNNEAPHLTIGQDNTIVDEFSYENTGLSTYENETITCDPSLEYSNDEESNLKSEEEDNNNTNESNSFIDDQNFFPELIEALSSDEITKNDLAIAYLTAFFNGSSTQDSLSDYIKLSNLTSSIKLPATFNGLSNLVIGKQNNLKFEKSWFCDICIKPFKNIPNRLQRSCNFCKTR